MSSIVSGCTPRAVQSPRSSFSAGFCISHHQASSASCEKICRSVCPPFLRSLKFVTRNLEFVEEQWTMSRCGAKERGSLSSFSMSTCQQMSSGVCAGFGSGSSSSSSFRGRRSRYRAFSCRVSSGTMALLHRTQHPLGLGLCVD